jgi:Fe2+ or Zn2+ uptake regulation protein
MRSVSALTDLLHANGLRVTPQRQCIFEILVEGHHPTIEAVHDAVVARMPTVSLATVYQALHDLESLGEVRLVHLGADRLRVDTRTDAHVDLVCRRCGTVQDADLGVPLDALLAGKPAGFVVETSPEIVVRGLCEQCAGQAATGPTAAGIVPAPS